MLNNLKLFLDAKVNQYNRPEFIENDPIVIPHQFIRKQDIEIIGFFAAILAWGQRKTIINKCRELIVRMDNAPFDFIKNHQETDLKALLGFKHRTFNDTDLLYFVSFFRQHYQQYESLEDAFLPSVTVAREQPVFREDFMDENTNASFTLQNSSSVCYVHHLVWPESNIETMLNHFRSYFFSLPDFPHRSKKHVSSPQQKSTCKRLNMFLRWMVRKDNCGVDFGIWTRIKPADLICPCDLHVDRVARKLKLIARKQNDWQTAVELTERLREFDPQDPVKYDFALFGLGIEEKF
ncbi:TIGR02757 family protein [uncultured Mucilaginibacter sp.]|uniref:TIGR02757 family protein n=1 Tax=uncultured Mucilaginibacter sp. TaxID=797541 RepID=UPI002627EBC3|nr:TIGR02757 family protein [uncultured Mucilaginibacter sp.]